MANKKILQEGPVHCEGSLHFPVLTFGDRKNRFYNENVRLQAMQCNHQRVSMPIVASNKM